MKKKLEDFGSSSYLEFDELITRVMCDTASSVRIADAAYLFGETADEESSSLATAVLVWKLKRVKRVAVCGADEGNGFPGFDNWKAKLIELGIDSKNIVRIPLADDFPPSTHAEAWGLARFAKKNKWKDIYIIAPPLHQLRAFITVVSAILRERALVKAYSFVGISQKWEEHINHSQGRVQGKKRSEFLDDELKKIEAYYKKGDLASAEEVLAYMDKRDG